MNYFYLITLSLGMLSCTEIFATQQFIKLQQTFYAEAHKSNEEECIRLLRENPNLLQKVGREIESVSPHYIVQSAYLAVLTEQQNTDTKKN